MATRALLLLVLDAGDVVANIGMVDTQALHSELLTVAEDIGRARAHLAKLLEKHLRLVERSVSGSSPPKMRVVDESPAKPLLLVRILSALEQGKLHSKDIATQAQHDPKSTYNALQDLKRKRGLVTGPEDGYWSISPKGREDLARRREESMAI